MTQCPLMEGVPLLEITNVVLCVDHVSLFPLGGVTLLTVTNVVFVCGPCLIVPLGRCHLTEGYKCSVCVWITTQCNLMRGVSLLEVTTVVFVCGS